MEPEAVAPVEAADVQLVQMHTRCQFVLSHLLAARPSESSDSVGQTRSPPEGRGARPPTECTWIGGTRKPHLDVRVRAFNVERSSSHPHHEHTEAQEDGVAAMTGRGIMV
jgi:hypothetical protein